MKLDGLLNDSGVTVEKTSRSPRSLAVLLKIYNAFNNNNSFNNAYYNNNAFNNNNRRITEKRGLKYVYSSS